MAMDAMEGAIQDYLMEGQIETHELMRAMRNSVARKILEEDLVNETNPLPDHARLDRRCRDLHR
jgi:hypothetical protein